MEEWCDQLISPTYKRDGRTRQRANALTNSATCIAEDARNIRRPNLRDRARLGQAGEHGLARERCADAGRPEARPDDRDLQRQHQQRKGEDRQQYEARR